jgi:hypothetical protein
MMSRIKSPRSNALKVLVMLPVTAFMVVVFACSPDQNVEKEVTLNQPTSNTEIVQPSIVLIRLQMFRFLKNLTMILYLW